MRRLRQRTPVEGGGLVTLIAAFTLIELLVVMTIIALLAAMLLPALSRAKAQAKSISCRNHLRQMEIALQLYTQDDSRNRFPHTTVATAGLWYTWVDYIAPYYPLNWTNPAYHCPGYSGWIQYIPIKNGEIAVAGGPIGSYGYNAFGSGQFADGSGQSLDNLLGLGPWYDTAAASPLPAVTESQVVAPSDMIAFGDSEMGEASGSELAMIAAYGVTYVPGGYAKGAGWGPFGDNVVVCPPIVPPGSAPLDPRSFPPRHGRNYNFVCCDGHVEGMPPSLLFSPWANAVRWNNDHHPHPETWPAR